MEAGRKPKEPSPRKSPEEPFPRQEYKEEKPMTKTLKVEGMMCGHCEARARKALEAVPGVESAAADHTAGTAVVTLGAAVADEALKAAVEAAGYKVTGIE